MIGIEVTSISEEDRMHLPLVMQFLNIAPRQKAEGYRTGNYFSAEIGFGPLQTKMNLIFNQASKNIQLSKKMRENTLNVTVSLWAVSYCISSSYTRKKQLTVSVDVEPKLFR